VKTPRRPHGSWRFIPPEDRALPPEEQTVFVLRPLTQEERMASWDNGAWSQRSEDGSKTILPRTFRLARENCLSHIEDVVNLQVPNSAGDGYTVPIWPKNGTPEEKAKFLEVLGDVEVLIVGNEILDRSSLDDEIKN